MGRTLSRLLLALGVLIVLTPVRADTIVKAVIEGDDIALPRKADGGRCAVAASDAKPGDLITLYAGRAHARRDRKDLTVILRVDTHRLLMVYHESKRFTEFSLPLNYNRLFPGGPGKNYDDLKRFNVLARIDPVPVSVNGSPASELGFTVANGLRMQYRVKVVLSAAHAGDAPLLLELYRLLNNLTDRGFGWVEALSLPDGMPMIWEESLRQPESEFVYRERVQSIEERALPAAT